MCGADEEDYPEENAKRIPIALRQRNLFTINHTHELMGPWIQMSRYLAYTMATEPVRAGKSFFSSFLDTQNAVTFMKLINQVRLHQPSIYALFQTILVMTNIVLVFSACVVALRLIGACGASSVQDVTINYRLLFRAYTASSIFVFGFVLLGSLFVLTCDYNINNGANILEDFLKYYKGNVIQYLDEDIIKVSDRSLRSIRVWRNTPRLEAVFRRDLFHYHAIAAQGSKKRKRKPLQFIPLPHRYRLDRNWSSLTRSLDWILNSVDLRHFNQVRITAKRTIEKSSTLFQRHEIQVIIRDLLSRMEGRVFAFEYEIDQVKKGVDNMTSILTTEEDNVLHLASIKYFVAYAITGFIMIVAISMTGMVGGFTLGYLNHNSKVSPLERNQLSNVAGYMLVYASYVMMFGVAAMLFFSSVVMLLGSIGDLYLCRAQRSGYLDSDAASLKDLTVSMVMKATVNQYYVDKLLRFSKVKRHCVNHLGISGLASMSGKALHDATKSVIDLQYDLSNHLIVNMKHLTESVLSRYARIKNLSATLVQTQPTLRANGTNEAASKAQVTRTLLFMIGSAMIEHLQKRDKHHDALKRVFFSFFLLCSQAAFSDEIKLGDAFDKIGNCDQIKAVFNACFEMLCNGILDYMNGLWLALLLLVFCFLYAIYISLVGSKYLFTMTSYTFEGEPVPEG
ncbi:unnamed protein product [Ixodes persulcatus]